MYFKLAPNFLWLCNTLGLVFFTSSSTLGEPIKNNMNDIAVPYCKHNTSSQAICFYGLNLRMQEKKAGSICVLLSKAQGFMPLQVSDTHVISATPNWALENLVRERSVHGAGGKKSSKRSAKLPLAPSNRLQLFRKVLNPLVILGIG